MAVKFFSTTHESGGGGSISVGQVTKMNIIATEEEPHITTINREFDNKFNKLPVEVLKMSGGQEDLIEVLADFDNADELDFQSNEFIKFDGVMSLEENYTDNMDLVENDIYEYSFEEVISKFKYIESASLT